MSAYHEELKKARLEYLLKVEQLRETYQVATFSEKCGALWEVALLKICKPFARKAAKIEQKQDPRSNLADQAVKETKAMVEGAKKQATLSNEDQIALSLAVLGLKNIVDGKVGTRWQEAEQLVGEIEQMVGSVGGNAGDVVNRLLQVGGQL